MGTQTRVYQSILQKVLDALGKASDEALDLPDEMLDVHFWQGLRRAESAAEDAMNDLVGEP